MIPAHTLALAPVIDPGLGDHPAILLFFVVFCFIGPLLYHTNQATPDLNAAFAPPSVGDLLGADDNGFDELGRIMKDGQTALVVAFLAAFIAIVIGAL